MLTFFSGFTLTLSLIFAIGAQNAFVLKQGLKQQHVFLVCIICAASDAVLIAAGVSGFGLMVKEFPAIEVYARYGGGAFLLLYSGKSFWSAFTHRHELQPAAVLIESAPKIALTCLAFTWLNPHVYLDTVVLLGSVSLQYEADKLEFGLGAVSASFVFFFSLGYGARLLAPLFQKPVAWQVLEFLVGIIMLFLAMTLLLSNT